jgi:hypothetical protein
VADRPRVIVASPDPAESAAVADWLQADGFDPVRRSTPQAAAEEMRARAVVLLIADAALVSGSALLRAQLRVRTPSTPTILIGDIAAAPQRDAVSGRTMHLSRPIDRALLACFVSMAILDGRPARRSVRKPVNHFDAVVNGVPSHIVDVSAEGLRLEVARDRRAALPPYFTLQVPLAGIAVTVRRMWTGVSSTRPSMIWYGGALSQNGTSVANRWQRFVDTLPAATPMSSL